MLKSGNYPIKSCTSLILQMKKLPIKKKKITVKIFLSQCYSLQDEYDLCHDPKHIHTHTETQSPSAHKHLLSIYYSHTGINRETWSLNSRNLTDDEYTIIMVRIKVEVCAQSFGNTAEGVI